MLFNSIEFVIFLPIVFTIYWLLKDKDIKYQNLTILLSSYIFYGWWDWRFLSLIFFSSMVDFIVAQSMGSFGKRGRRYLLYLSFLVNLGFLGVFKYF